MKDQHTLIKTYRDLSQEEINLINELKEFGNQTAEMIVKVTEHLELQQQAAKQDADETARLQLAEPFRWLAMARTDFQLALMKITRAVAQPGGPI